MEFYEPNHKIDFDDTYSNKTLLELVKIDPKYIETCVLNIEFFCLTESVIQELKAANPKFNLSLHAMMRLYQKYDYWVFIHVENEVEWYPAGRYDYSQQSSLGRYYIEEAKREAARRQCYNFWTFVKYGKEAIEHIYADKSMNRRSEYSYKAQSQDESPYYNENLDLDQQSMEFWNSI